MTLSYTCSYEQAEAETEEETEAQSESESETETESAGNAGTKKEAKFYFRYQNGDCVVTSAEIPGVL